MVLCMLMRMIPGRRDNWYCNLKRVLIAEGNFLRILGLRYEGFSRDLAFDQRDLSSTETGKKTRINRGSGKLASLTQRTLSKLQETVKDRKPGVLQFMGSQRVTHNWLSDWTTVKLVDLVLERWDLSHCFYFNQKSWGMISNLDTGNTQESRKSPWVYANFARSMEKNRGLRIDLWSFNLSVTKSDLTSYAYLPNGGTWGWGHIIL